MWIFFIITMFLPLTFSYYGENVVNTVNDFQKMWIQFKMENKKNYNTIDDALRFDIFKRNYQLIEEANKLYLSGTQKFKLAMNQFADLSKEEFLKKYLSIKKPTGLISRHRRQAPANINNSNVPDFMDWRNAGAVTAVKDQGECGACWSFSAVGAIESQYFIQTGNLVNLSAQQLIDCAENGENEGCTGGWMGYAFEFLEQHDLHTEAEYPYAEAKRNCQAMSSYSNISLRGYAQLPYGDESEIRNNLAIVGPISSGMDASNLQFYSTGIYSDNDCDKQTINHGVIIIGYGSENGQDYWLVKNSWGEKWGENGYFKIARNSNDMCNIASYGMIPLL